jgi:thiol-disulfide isomerase/thioredoxin
MKLFVSRVALALLLAAALCHGQKESKDLSAAEQKDLSQALSETGGSPVEFIRALERHLAKYPNSPQKDELEMAIAKAAIEAKDTRRTVLYGERSLSRNMDNPLLLERVSRALLNADDRQSSEHALKYSKKLEDLLLAMEKDGLAEKNKGQMKDELDRGIARALAFEARATGNLGKYDDAVALATQSYARYPSAESAREMGRWLAKAGTNAEAITHYADAFTIADKNNSEADRIKDRAKLSELYRKEHNTEAGLGDLILEAWDRTAAITVKRTAAQHLRDPNADLTDLMDFTITGLDGNKLPLTSLRGKVVVMDFWATWCGPCRVQHPLYEKVKQRFAKRDDVVFLAIDTDEDQTLVKPFLEEQKWSKKVYFEDGLSALLRVQSIPATLIIDKEGRLFSRMNGFLPERFVDMLSERIDEALAANDPAAPPAPATR